MTTAITTTDGRAISTYSPAQLELIRNTVAKGCSDLEMALFFEVARETGLDPWARQIYAIVRKDHGVPKMVIQTGIDGYRAMAARSGEYGGQDEPTFDCCTTGDCGKIPGSARVTVYRIVKGVRCPFTARVSWREFAPSTNLQDVTMTMWRKMPHLMVSKCAEAKALRMAFPLETAKVEFGGPVGPVDVLEGEIIVVPNPTV